MRGLKSKSKPTPTSPVHNTAQIDRDHQLNATGMADSSNGNGIVHSDRINGSVGTVHPTRSKSKDLTAHPKHLVLLFPTPAKLMKCILTFL